MRVGELEANIEAQAKNLMLDFDEFTTGTRFLKLLHRNKEGGPTSESKRRGGFAISHSPEEYYDALVRLLTLKTVSSKPYRLYASVNARDLLKAEHQFKIEMIEAEFAGGETREYFWKNGDSKWAGALMKPRARASSYFLLDIDGGEETLAPVLKWLGEQGMDYVKQYQTPGGYHIITKPFNPNDFKFEGVEIKKDALLLLTA